MTNKRKRTSSIANIHCIDDWGKMMNAKSKDRIAFSIFVWLQTMGLCFWMYYMWIYNCAPLDFDVELFLSLTLCLFAIGHVIEWTYHVFASPLAVQRQGHVAKKALLSVFVLISIVTGILTAIILFVDAPNIVVMVCFVLLLVLVVIIFRCRGIAESLNRLFNGSRSVSTNFSTCNLQQNTRKDNTDSENSPTEQNHVTKCQQLSQYFCQRKE